jgi:hypothetical protein
MRSVEHRVQQLSEVDLDPDEDFDTSEGEVEANPGVAIEYGVTLTRSQLQGLERIARDDDMPVGAVIRRMVDVGLQMDTLQRASRHLDEARSRERNADTSGRSTSAFQRLVRELRARL